MTTASVDLSFVGGMATDFTDEVFDDFQGLPWRKSSGSVFTGIDSDPAIMADDGDDAIEADATADGNWVLGESTQRMDSKVQFDVGIQGNYQYVAADAGSLDSSFGNGGWIELSHEFFAVDLALQPDGRIIVVGRSDSTATLVRYNSDGSLDTTFGGEGTVRTNLGWLVTTFNSVAVQPDGK